jgi:hypothetical protein
MSEEVLTAERLRELLAYDAKTGLFTSLTKRGNQAAGAIASSVDGKGYIRVKLDGRDYRAHRLAWLYTYGVWPRDQIDHIDMVRTNNALLNLREATNSLNNANRGVARNNKSGLKGVRFDVGRRKWRAEIKKNGSAIHLGRFATAGEAATAYAAAASIHFGNFARTM